MPAAWPALDLRVKAGLHGRDALGREVDCVAPRDLAHNARAVPGLRAQYALGHNINCVAPALGREVDYVAPALRRLRRPPP